MLEWHRVKGASETNTTKMEREVRWDLDIGFVIRGIYWIYNIYGNLYNCMCLSMSFTYKMRIKTINTIISKF